MPIRCVLQRLTSTAAAVATVNSLDFTLKFSARRQKTPATPAPISGSSLVTATEVEDHHAQPSPQEPPILADDAFVAVPTLLDQARAPCPGPRPARAPTLQSLEESRSVPTALHAQELLLGRPPVCNLGEREAAQTNSKPRKVRVWAVLGCRRALNLKPFSIHPGKPQFEGSSRAPCLEKSLTKSLHHAEVLHQASQRTKRSSMIFVTRLRV